jgi:hypothetical protein
MNTIFSPSAVGLLVRLGSGAQVLQHGSGGKLFRSFDLAMLWQVRQVEFINTTYVMVL